GHGLLHGYAEHGSGRVTRGRRILCSNRGRKRGCGRTVSTLLSRFVQRSIVAAATLWTLFCGLAEGLSVERAAQHAHFPQTLRSAYRTAAALQRNALGWRSWLSTKKPAASASTRPLGQLREHLTHALGQNPFEHRQFRNAVRLR